MLHSQVLGSHEPDNGEGITLQEMLDLLRSIPRRVRDNYLMTVRQDGTPIEVSGLHFSQSDQAEKWEFKVYIRTAREAK